MMLFPLQMNYPLHPPTQNPFHMKGHFLYQCSLSMWQPYKVSIG